MHEMTRRTIFACALLGLCALCTACLPTRPLLVRTASGEPASLSARLVAGTQAPIPAQCQTPCSIAVPDKCTYEISLEAVGYYPVVVTVSYDMVLNSVGGADNKATLVVPMVPR